MAGCGGSIEMVLDIIVHCLALRFFLGLPVLRHTKGFHEEPATGTGIWSHVTGWLLVLISLPKVCRTSYGPYANSWYNETSLQVQ